MNKKILLYLIILASTLFIVGCTFMDEWLFPTTTYSTPPRATLTFADGEPTYIGQDFTVRVTLSPRKTVNYIRVVMVDLINDRETVMQQDYAYEGTFKFKVTSSKFRFYVETPYQNKSRGSEVYYPSKDFWYEFADYTPPTVSYSFERVNNESNQYRLNIKAEDEQSGVKEVYLEVDGVRESVNYSAEARAIEKIITLSIGYHTVTVYARNEKGLTGFREQTIEVTPPYSTQPPVIELNMDPSIEVFSGETVYINANVYDNISYLDSVELRSTNGWLKKITFDPIQENYYLNYPVKAEKNEVINIKAKNSNNRTSETNVAIVVNTHKAPDTTLTVTPAVEELEKGSEVEIFFDTEAYDGEKIDMIYLLVNNSTYRTFDVNEETTYTDSAKYTLKNGENTFSVVAVDTMGARGGSNQITITGFKVDREPPSIMMLLPDVAYQGVEVELPFIVEDYDSGLKGSPVLKRMDTDTAMVVNSLGGYYFKSRWVPENIQQYSFSVGATDNSDNYAYAEKTVTVKDPTGILWPTVGTLAAAPNPAKLGDTINLTLSVVPPQTMSQEEINVNFEVGVNGENPEKLTNIVNNGNIYSAAYKPELAGNYSGTAYIYWGDDNVSETTAFTIESPAPTMTFSVEPSKTYTGGNVVLSLITDTTNPFASVTVLEMSADLIPLTWSVIETNDQRIYRATKSTIDLPSGQHIARAKIRDTFGEESVAEKLFYTEPPELVIKSVNLTPKIGQIFRVYNPVDFEVYLESTIPPEIVASGEVELIPPAGITKTVQLQQATDNVYKYLSEQSWIPDQEGQFEVNVKFNALIGTELLEASNTQLVDIQEQDIVIDITASPMSIDNITVGREVELVFDINGIMEDDSIQNIKYALYQGTSLIYGPSIPTMIETNRYSDNISFFNEPGDYEVVATVTTLASVKEAHRAFTVSDSEIAKISFALDGLQQNLYYGSPMKFRLELDNPDQMDNIRVTMFLVDDTLQKIESVNTLAATAIDSGYSVFENTVPFQLYREGRFYAAASVTLSQVPAIHLPTIYTDTYYEMPGPNLNIEYDESKDYYGGYTGSLDLTITKPSSMVLQTPILEKISGIDNLILTPYATPSDPNGTRLEYKFYVKPMKPDVATEFTFRTTLYDIEDVSNQTPVLPPTETTFQIQRYEPVVDIRVINGQAGTVNKCKDPQIEFKVEELPEFFDGTFNFYTTLNGFNPLEGANIISTEPSTVLTFSSYNYSGIDAGNTLNVFAEVTGYNNRPNENFTATGTTDMTVTLPGIGRIDIISPQQLPIYTENEVMVEFATLEAITKNIIVVLETEDNGNTVTYPPVTPAFDGAIGRATFTNVVFNVAGAHQATATIYCNNAPTDIPLGSPETKVLQTYDSEPRVLVKYPSQTDEIFYKQPIRPVIECVSIPGVDYVNVAIIDPKGNVNEQRISSSVGDEWTYPLDYTVNSVGEYTIHATAVSRIVDVATGTNTFEATDGSITVEVPSISGGKFKFTQNKEQIVITGKFTYENPYNVDNLTLNASVTGTLGDSLKVDILTPLATRVNGNAVSGEIVYQLDTGTAKEDRYKVVFKVLSVVEEQSKEAEFILLNPINFDSGFTPPVISVNNQTNAFLNTQVSSLFMEVATPVEFSDVSLSLTGNYLNYLTEPAASLTVVPVGSDNYEISVKYTGMTAVQNDDLTGSTVELDIMFIPKVEGEQYDPTKSNKLTIHY